MRWNVLCKIFRRSRSRGPKLRVGWLIFDLFIFHLFIKRSTRKGVKDIWWLDREVYRRIRSNYSRIKSSYRRNMCLF